MAKRKQGLRSRRHRRDQKYLMGVDYSVNSDTGGLESDVVGTVRLDGRLLWAGKLEADPSTGEVTFPPEAFTDAGGSEP